MKNIFTSSDNSEIQEQVSEIMKCMDPKTGYIHFIQNHVKVANPIYGVVPFEMRSHQVDLLKFIHKRQATISCIERQRGKSTCMVAYVLWHAMFNKNEDCLILSPNAATSQEFMSKIRFVYDNCPHMVKSGIRNETKSSVIFENGSRISSTIAGTRSRGLRPSLTVYEELAYMNQVTTSELLRDINGVKRTGGKVIVISSWNSDSDPMADLWRGSNATPEKNRTGEIVNMSPLTPFHMI